MLEVLSNLSEDTTAIPVTWWSMPFNTIDLLSKQINDTTNIHIKIELIVMDN